jgi:hypothetical protein
MVCGFLRGHRPLTGSQKEVANHSRSAEGNVVIEPKWDKSDVWTDNLTT